MVEEIAIGFLAIEAMKCLLMFVPKKEIHDIKACQFDDKLTEKDFANVAKSCAKKFNRIGKCRISGSQIECEVYSKSENSTWNFTISFNSYGHITGRYWIKAENEDSNIPERLAQMIQQKIYCS